jgi:hypothetical protein
MLGVNIQNQWISPFSMLNRGGVVKISDKLWSVARWHIDAP